LIGTTNIERDVGALGWKPAIDSPCECEHNNPDSLDARLFLVLAVAPAVTMDEASSLSPEMLSRLMSIRIYINPLRVEIDVDKNSHLSIREESCMYRES